MDKAALSGLIQRFSTGKVLVVGDIAIDEMVYGDTSRLSREAPVMILHHAKTDILLGAGGNAAHNLAALGAQKITMVGLAGKDYHAGQLYEAMERDGISTEGMIQDPSRPTITKTRITGRARQSVEQQIVRIDRESHEPIAKQIEYSLIERIAALAPSHNAMIISDYKLGVLTPAVIRTCQKVAEAGGMVLAVDSHQDLRLFEGATIATPNQPEAEENLGRSLSSQEALIEGGRELKLAAKLKNLLITQGSEGMTLFDAQGAIHHIGAFNKSEVFDVTGAGDTVIATLTLAMATGSNPLQAMLLGNLAASIVVKKYGTAVTNPVEMIATLEEMEPAMLEVKSMKAKVSA